MGFKRQERVAQASTSYMYQRGGKSRHCGGWIAIIARFPPRRCKLSALTVPSDSSGFHSPNEFSSLSSSCVITYHQPYLQFSHADLKSCIEVPTTDLRGARIWYAGWPSLQSLLVVRATDGSHTRGWYLEQARAQTRHRGWSNLYPYP